MTRWGLLGCLALWPAAPLFAQILPTPLAGPAALERAWDLAKTLSREAELARVERILARGGAVPPEDKAFLEAALPGLTLRGLIGRPPTPEEKAEIEGWLPGLAAQGDWRVTGEWSREYNCIAWTVGLSSGGDLWAWGDYLEHFDALYLRYALVPLASGEPAALADVAVLGLGKDVLHATRHAAGSLWESKLGPSLRILHRLPEIEGGDYGRVLRFYRRSGPARASSSSL